MQLLGFCNNLNAAFVWYINRQIRDLEGKERRLSAFCWTVISNTDGNFYEQDYPESMSEHNMFTQLLLALFLGHHFAP